MPKETLHTCPTCGIPNFTARGLKAHRCKSPSAAPGGTPSSKSDSKSGKKVAPGTPSKAVELELVEEPKPLLAKKSVTQCYSFSDPEKIEAAIMEALADEEASRRRSALADLRSGVLFHLYKVSMGVGGRKYTGFWEKCEKRFGITRMTISRKMRLALIWAKESGAKETAIQALAQATDLGDTTNAALPLAIDWIGDRTTTDLYRDYGLVNYGPKGGDLSEHRTGKRRTQEEIQVESFEAEAEAQCLIAQTQIDKLLSITGPKGESPLWLLDAAGLEKLKLSAFDLHKACLETEKRRKRK